MSTAAAIDPALRDRLSAVCACLRKYRYDASSEVAFQTGVSRALELGRFIFAREVRLGPRDRIDFLVDGGVGLELKINGAPSEVTRQLSRYAESEQIAALVLVTTRALHRMQPGTLLGKPLHVHWQGGLS